MTFLRNTASRINFFSLKASRTRVRVLSCFESVYDSLKVDVRKPSWMRKISDVVLSYWIYSHIFFGRIYAVKNESENKVKEMSDKVQQLENQ